VERGVRGSGVLVDPERVRQARVIAGLTLAQLAGKEVSRTFIHQVEHGLARPSPPVLRLIARRTGKPLSYFVRSAAGAALTAKELSAELSTAASRVRRFVAINALNPTEREAMKLVEVSLRQGATLARGLPTRAPK
jgi:transcriptional regulator with XRE-family HTH domain